MTTASVAYKYGMKEPQKRLHDPQARPDRSKVLIVLSLAEIVIAGPFAAIPVFWSIAYGRAAKTDPATPLRKTAQVSVIAVGATSAAIALFVTFLYLLGATVP